LDHVGTGVAGAEIGGDPCAAADLEAHDLAVGHEARGCQVSPTADDVGQIGDEADETA
jgi:hypothetical protein